MTYKFRCDKCDKTEDIEMSMKDYTSEGHVCSECGSPLHRDMSSYTTANAIWKCSGAFGVNRD